MKQTFKTNSGSFQNLIPIFFLFLISCTATKVNKPMYCQPYKGYKAKMVGSEYRTSLLQKRTHSEKIKKFE